VNIKIENNCGSREKTIALVKQINSLPVDPEVVSEILLLLKNPNANFGNLAKNIQRDHGLLVKVLSIANSKHNVMPKRIYSIERAIIMLGLEKLKSIVTETGNNNLLKSHDTDEWYRNYFWRHSILVANTAKSIAEDLDYRNPEEVFIAGLLHDIGILVTRYFFPEDFHEFKLLVEQEGFPVKKAEEIILGINHSEIGKILIEKWNLPGIISEAVEYHHAPSSAGEGIIVSSIIHLSDFMINGIGMSKNFWDIDLELDDKCVSILKLSEGEFGGQLPFVYLDVLREIMNKENTKSRNYL